MNSKAHLLANARQHADQRIDRKLVDLVIYHIRYSRTRYVKYFRRHSLRDACFTHPSGDLVHQLPFQPNRFIDLCICLSKQPFRLLRGKSQIKKHVPACLGAVV